MELITITPDILENAPERPKVSRGRQKGSSPVEKAVRTFVSSEDTAFGAAFTNSEYAALRLAVCRVNGIESSRKADYESALESLDMTETFLGQTGEGNERVITLALVKNGNA